MYNRDMPVLARHGFSSADGFADICTFVFCTIQQPLQSVGTQLADIRINGADSKYLFSAKRKGYRYVQQHKRMLWRGLMIAKQKNDVIRAVELLTNIPSLGMAKAGFVAQCLGFNVACLDSHNLDRLGYATFCHATMQANKTCSAPQKDCRLCHIDTKTWCEILVGYMVRICSR
jgi:hypothetical protein